MGANNLRRIWQAALALIAATCLFASAGIASEAEKPVKRIRVIVKPKKTKKTSQKETHRS